MLKKLIVILLIALPLCLKAQSADEVITKYLNYIGGSQKWGAIKTITTTGTYNYGGIKFPFFTYAKAPNLYKFVVPLKGKYYAQAFNGTDGWKIDAFKNETKPTFLKGKEARAMANEADVETEPSLVNYKQKGHLAVAEGTDTVAGKKYLKVKLTLKNGETEYYFFDTQTTALVIKRMASKNAELSGGVIDLFYSDYRDIGGVKIPFTAISKIKTQTILTIITEKATINTPVADDTFKADLGKMK